MTEHEIGMRTRTSMKGQDEEGNLQVALPLVRVRVGRRKSRKKRERNRSAGGDEA